MFSRVSFRLVDINVNVEPDDGESRPIRLGSQQSMVHEDKYNLVP